MEQVARRGGRVPPLDGDIQKPEHYPGQPTLGDPVWAGGVRLDDFQRSLSTSIIQWFCNKIQGNTLK